MTINDLSILSALKTHITETRDNVNATKAALEFQKRLTEKSIEAIGDTAIGQNIDFRV
jgi:hypothetical protein